MEGLENYLGDDVEIHFSDGENSNEAIRFAKEADTVVIVAGYEGEYINMGERTQDIGAGNGNPQKQKTMAIFGGKR